MADNNIKNIYNGQREAVYPKTVVAAVEGLDDFVADKTTSLGLVTTTMLSQSLEPYVLTSTLSSYQDEVANTYVTTISLTNTLSNYITRDEYDDRWTGRWASHGSSYNLAIAELNQNITRLDRGQEMLNNLYNSLSTSVRAIAAAQGDMSVLRNYLTVSGAYTLLQTDTARTIVRETMAPSLEAITATISTISSTLDAITGSTGSLSQLRSDFDTFLNFDYSTTTYSVNSLMADTTRLSSEVGENTANISLLTNSVNAITVATPYQNISSNTQSIYINAVNGSDAETTPIEGPYKTLNRAFEVAINRNIYNARFQFYSGTYTTTFTTFNNVNWKFSSFDGGSVFINSTGGFTWQNSTVDFDELIHINTYIIANNCNITTNGTTLQRLTMNGGKLYSFITTFSDIFANGAYLYNYMSTFTTSSQPFTLTNGSQLRLLDMPNFSTQSLDCVVYLQNSDLLIPSQVKQDIIDRIQALDALGHFPKQGFCQIITD